MKIVPINNTNFKSEVRFSLEAVRNANQKMIQNRGKIKELTPMDKLADFLLTSLDKQVPLEFREVQKEFNNLPKNEQTMLLAKAKIRRLVSDKERVAEATRKAWNMIFSRK